ncbi:hypothetical protein [Lentibacillus sp. CBA3610]|uniref:hypothetical protein n=1 Tax=Lentibacillus sp. CBA3610 TaxID=2518176 RepID=UPI001595BF14|nr:hypothetical protein [Lentibacillus sp. CBA3610]QKY70291.1 hypothetical protein Len3610_12425 [Lentibacillus sp. CBA3610]
MDMKFYMKMKLRVAEVCMIIYPYKIEECGFYKRGEKKPEFGEPSHLIRDFLKWLHSKTSILSTATFDSSEDNIRRVFCIETVSDEKEESYGVVLWNEIPQHEEGVSFIPLKSKIGNVKASTIETSEESIPGWPTYLWFVPKKSLVVSLVPDNMRGFRSSGIKQARKYFENFLYYKSSYVVKENTHEDQQEIEHNIIGWRKQKK